MNFNTASFTLFLLIVLGAYYLLQRCKALRSQNLVLLVASYVFYASWDPRFLFLICLSTAVDYLCGLHIANRKVKLTARIAVYSGLFVAACFVFGSTTGPDFAWPAGEAILGTAALAAVLVLAVLEAIGWCFSGETKRRYYLTFSVTSNLGILFGFKYFDFFLDSLNQLMLNVGIDRQVPLLGIVVPVGISFYTFQTLSYTIDIYRRELRPTRDLCTFALFVAYFPQLVAGPIERARVLLPQLCRPRTIDWPGLQSGAYLIGWGLFKKIFIADSLAPLVDHAYAEPASAGSLQILLSTYAFAFQIYCDFSAYSDIARGVSRLLGIELMVNFYLPYFATNPQDFWRRWHISLSTWLRDYLYISLGGGRRGPMRTYANLMTTMVLGGIWHGAAMNFLLWGIYQGALLCFHRFYLSVRGLREAKRRTAADVLIRFGTWFAFFHMMCYGWLLFRAASFADILDLTIGLFQPWQLDTTAVKSAVKLLWFTWPLILVQWTQSRSGNLLAPLYWWWPVRALWYVLLFYLAVVFGVFDEPSFIYFQF